MRIQRSALALVAFALVLVSAHAQQATRTAQVGVLAGGSQRVVQNLLEEFRAGMRDLGYIEGQHFVIDIRAADGSLDRLPQLAADLVRGKVDVILVGVTTSLQAARQATSTIPIVMVGVGDPVGTGFIASLERPGGNITGVVGSALPQTDTLQVLKEIVPTLSRLAVLANPNDGFAVRAAKNWGATARAAAIELHPFEVDQFDRFERAFAAMELVRPDGLVVVPDSLIFSSRARIAELAAKYRLPTIYTQKDYVDAGGLIAYGVSLRSYYRRSATYVDKILKGAKPGELPVDVPMKGELSINLEAARALGLSMPQSLMSRAAHVVP